MRDLKPIDGSLLSRAYGASCEKADERGTAPCRQVASPASANILRQHHLGIDLILEMGFFVEVPWGQIAYQIESRTVSMDMNRTLSSYVQCQVIVMEKTYNGHTPRSVPPFLKALYH